MSPREFMETQMARVDQIIPFARHGRLKALYGSEPAVVSEEYPSAPVLARLGAKAKQNMRASEVVVGPGVSGICLGFVAAPAAAPGNRFVGEVLLPCDLAGGCAGSVRVFGTADGNRRADLKLRPVVPIERVSVNPRRSRFVFLSVSSSCAPIEAAVAARSSLR
jgi:hypothetical protein